MIKKIHIENYRSCLDTTFHMQPDLSVLIGPNGSGKTTILNAILLLKKLIGEEYSIPEEPPTGQCKIKAWFRIGDKQAILTTNIETYTDENNNDVVVASHQQWYIKDFTGNGKRLNLPLWLAIQMGLDGSSRSSIGMKRRLIFPQ